MTDSSRRCPSADRSSSLAPSNIPPYRLPCLPLDVLYLTSFTTYAAFPIYLHVVWCVPNHAATIFCMADNRCAGLLTTSSPTANSWCTKTLSSTHARSTVLCPPTWPTISFAVSVGKAPHGEARLPQVSIMSPPLHAPIRSSSIFYGSAMCSLRKSNPSGRRLIRGLRLLTSRWTLTSTLWCLLTSRQHFRESASFYAWCTWRNRTNAHLWL